MTLLRQKSFRSSCRQQLEGSVEFGLQLVPKHVWNLGTVVQNRSMIEVICCQAKAQALTFGRQTVEGGPWLHISWLWLCRPFWQLVAAVMWLPSLWHVSVSGGLEMMGWNQSMRSKSQVLLLMQGAPLLVRRNQRCHFGLKPLNPVFTTWKMPTWVDGQSWCAWGAGLTL